MNARRRAPVQRRALEGGGDALLVHGVPAFVHRAEQAGVEEVGREARGDADVTLPEVDAEGVHG